MKITKKNKLIGLALTALLTVGIVATAVVGIGKVHADSIPSASLVYDDGAALATQNSLTIHKIENNSGGTFEIGGKAKETPVGVPLSGVAYKLYLV
jgi:hypothetical protein